MNSGRMQDSSEESLHVEANANVNVTRLNLPKDPVQIITATLLALSIVINVWLILEYRAAGTEQRLQQYNLDWFKTHEFSDLKSQVELQDKLIPVQCKR